MVGRKEEGDGWNVSCAEERREPAGQKAKDVERIQWNRGNAQ